MGGCSEERHGPKRPFARWPLVAAAIAVLLVVVVSRGGEEDPGAPSVELPEKQLRVEPDAVAPGTTMAIRGGPCERPDGWTSGRIYFGLHDPRAPDEASQNPDKDEVALEPGSGWSGQLTVPAAASPGSYGVYAECWAQDPNGESKRFDWYEPVEFTVE